MAFAGVESAESRTSERLIMAAEFMEANLARHSQATLARSILWLGHQFGQIGRKGAGRKTSPKLGLVLHSPSGVGAVHWRGEGTHANSQIYLHLHNL